MAAYELLTRLPQMPDFLMVIDDDTFVNPTALYHFVNVSRDLVDKPVYMGHGGSRRMAMGGGGTIITRAVLDAWKNEDGSSAWAALRWCIEQTQGGAWCHWHSDWAYGMCVHKWTGINVTNTSHAFNQFRYPCTAHHVACHMRLDPSDWVRTWNLNYCTHSPRIDDTCE